MILFSSCHLADLCSLKKHYFSLFLRWSSWTSQIYSHKNIIVISSFMYVQPSENYFVSPLEVLFVIFFNFSEIPLIWIKLIFIIIKAGNVSENTSTCIYFMIYFGCHQLLYHNSWIISSTVDTSVSYKVFMNKLKFVYFYLSLIYHLRN